LEEDKAIKERHAPKVDKQKPDMDEDDDMSEGEKEILEEINNDMDGNVKIAKNMRGYDD